MSYQKERAEFVATMALELATSSDSVTDLVHKICREATIINTHAVNACNRETTQAEDDRAEKAAARLAELCAPHGIKVKTCGDPRGYVVKLLLPRTERYNTWGGKEEGWGVPTRD